MGGDRKFLTSPFGQGGKQKARLGLSRARRRLSDAALAERACFNRAAPSPNRRTPPRPQLRRHSCRAESRNGRDRSHAPRKGGRENPEQTQHDRICYFLLRKTERAKSNGFRVNRVISDIGRSPGIGLPDRPPASAAAKACSRTKTDSSRAARLARRRAKSAISAFIASRSSRKCACSESSSSRARINLSHAAWSESFPAGNGEIEVVVAGSRRPSMSACIARSWASYARKFSSRSRSSCHSASNRRRFADSAADSVGAPAASNERCPRFSRSSIGVEEKLCGDGLMRARYPSHRPSPRCARGFHPAFTVCSPDFSKN